MLFIVPMHRGNFIKLINAFFIVVPLLTALSWLVWTTGVSTPHAWMGMLIVAVLWFAAVQWTYRKFLHASDNLYRQQEALLALYQTVKPNYGLPPMRGWSCSPDHLNILADLILNHKPVTLVDCGSGISTLVMAAMVKHQGHGHVYALEHNAEYAGLTRALLQRHGLEGKATILDAPLQNHTINNKNWLWYGGADRLPASIDLVHIDGPPAHQQRMARFPTLPMLKSKLLPHALLILDDAYRLDERQTLASWETLGWTTKPKWFDTEKGTVVVEVNSTLRTN